MPPPGVQATHHCAEARTAVVTCKHDHAIRMPEPGGGRSVQVAIGHHLPAIRTG
jgi:hypothetical protein